jgi:hypothetical protein
MSFGGAGILHQTVEQLVKAPSIKMTARSYAHDIDNFGDHSGQGVLSGSGT